MDVGLHFIQSRRVGKQYFAHVGSESKCVGTNNVPPYRTEGISFWHRTPPQALCAYRGVRGIGDASICPGITQIGEIMKQVIAVALLALISIPSIACDKAAALKVRNMINEMGQISESGGKVSVRWGSDFNYWNEDQKQGMARTAADADACLTGKPREIRFYSPAGKLITVASPSGGIMLIK